MESELLALGAELAGIAAKNGASLFRVESRQLERAKS